MPRPFIIDECVDKRVAAQLKGRGRGASALAEMGLIGVGDKELLETIAVQWPSSVLITFDDTMPADHRDTLRKTKVTVAIVDPRKPPGLTVRQWQFEVIHRWAHQIAQQKGGTVRRYGERSVVWVDRKGRRPRPQATSSAAVQGSLFPT